MEVCLPLSTYFDRFLANEHDISVKSLVSRIAHVRRERMNWDGMLEKIQFEKNVYPLTFLDDESREIVHSAHMNARGEEDSANKFLSAWFSLPMLRRDSDTRKEDDEEDTASSSSSPKGGAKRRKLTLQRPLMKFVPRAVINGKTVLLPFIWIDIQPCEERMLPNVVVKESSLICNGYRIVLANTSKQKNDRCIARVDLPVYRHFERPLSFTLPVSQFRTGIKRIRPFQGTMALLAHLIETDNTRMTRKSDRIRIERDDQTGEVDNFALGEFEIDLTICWDVKNGRLMSVHGTHAHEDVVYYVLVTQQNEEDRLYLLHVDKLRDTDESTGLDVCYRYPLLTEKQ